MPLYEKSVTTTTDHKKASPLRTPWKLTHGVIYRIQPEFAPGAQGTCKAVILHREQQLWPTNIGEVFHGNGPLPAFDVWFPLTSPPYELTIVTWLEEAAYKHEFTIRLGILPWYLARPFLSIHELVTMLKRIFRV